MATRSSVLPVWTADQVLRTFESSSATVAATVAATATSSSPSETATAFSIARVRIALIFRLPDPWSRRRRTTVERDLRPSWVGPRAWTCRTRRRGAPLWIRYPIDACSKELSVATMSYVHLSNRSRPACSRYRWLFLSKRRRTPGASLHGASTCSRESRRASDSSTAGRWQ